MPLLTVTQAILRWGAICEHKYNLTNPSVAESAPIIVLRWWDKLLLPNLNFTLHPYHHYFPGIPHASLPRVHEIFRREGLVNEANVFHGYWSFLRFVLQPAVPDRDVATAPRLPASSAPSANLSEATHSSGRTLGGLGGIGGGGGGEGEAAIARRGVQAGN